LLTILTNTIKTKDTALWKSIYCCDCRFTHPDSSRHLIIPLKKRSSPLPPIYNDLAEFVPHRIFPRFPIVIYQIYCFGISSSAIRRSYPTHLGRPSIFPSISQPTIPLYLHSLSHFRGHSKRFLHLILPSISFLPRVEKTPQPPGLSATFRDPDTPARDRPNSIHFYPEKPVLLINRCVIPWFLTFLFDYSSLLEFDPCEPHFSLQLYHDCRLFMALVETKCSEERCSPLWCGSCPKNLHGNRSSGLKFSLF
jgi:hypothetical protein